MYRTYSNRSKDIIAPQMRDVRSRATTDSNGEMYGTTHSIEKIVHNTTDCLLCSYHSEKGINEIQTEDFTLHQCPGLRALCISNNSPLWNSVATLAFANSDSTSSPA